MCSCNDTIMSPIDFDKVAPGKLTDINVESMPGGVFINYKLPGDKDILYVKAKYKLDNGEQQIINASYFDKGLKIEGFAKVKEYEAALTCIDRSGNESEVEIVRFTPKMPPVISIEKSMKVQSDFGGINMTWNNNSESPIAIIVSIKDKNINEYKIVDTYYSTAKLGNYSTRGLKSENTDFKIQVRDKWGNYSAEILTTLTPVYETRLDRKLFKAMGGEYSNNVKDLQWMYCLWDDKYEDNIFGNATVPWYASLDLGVKARLSRVVLWQYSWASYKYAHYYAGGNMKKCRIYGSNNPTTDMSGWTLLVECEITKKSGLPIGVGRDNQSEEDFDIAHNKGHEFNIPLDAPSVRYIRIESLEAFETTLGVPSEAHFYGNDKISNEIN